MAMELLSFHDQFIAYLSAHEERDNFAFIDIIQGTQVSYTQFIGRKKIGAQALDRFGGRRRLMLQPGQDRRLQDSLLAYWQRPELPIGLLGDRNLERHGTDSATLTRFNQGCVFLRKFLFRQFGDDFVDVREVRSSILVESYSDALEPNRVRHSKQLVAVSFLRMPIATVYPNPHLVGVLFRTLNDLSDSLIGNKSARVLMPGKQVQLRSSLKRPHRSPSCLDLVRPCVHRISVS
jgi:hypothetical protein